jgi:propanol-preferring alcohol dehydrogenase
VLVQVEACGVGRTVLNCINGNLNDGKATLPLVPGHELVGVVVGAGDERGEQLLGKRVVAYFYLICESCPACLAGREPQCANLAGWLGVHRDGGYAPLVTLPVANAIELPDGLDPVAATVVPDAVATPVHVAGRAGISSDDRVVVIGAGGGVGLHMVQVAGLSSDAVVGLDVGAHKLAAIGDRGFRAADSSDFTKLGDLFDDGPPTVVVDFVGTRSSMDWALASLGMGGRLVALTTFPDRPLTYEARTLVFHESAILGSRYASRAEVRRAAELIAAGSIEPAIGGVRPAADVLELHDALHDGTLIGRGAIDWRST